MSYTILYRAMFAKVGENKYIPMIESGSNNCYVGRKRERNWNNWVAPHKEHSFIVSEQDIYVGLFHDLDRVNKLHVNQFNTYFNKYLTYRDVKKNYGWLSGLAISGKSTENTTNRMFVNFMYKGIKNCFDLTDKSWCFCPHRLPLVLFEYTNKGDLFPQKRYFKTLDEMVDYLEKSDAANAWIQYDETAETIWETIKNRKQ